VKSIAAGVTRVFVAIFLAVIKQVFKAICKKKEN
jgi:hypothetical protein